MVIKFSSILNNLFSKLIIDYPHYMNLANKEHPKYEPELWNSDIKTQNAHNCYSYALNLIHHDQADMCGRYMKKTKDKYCKMFKPQPGRYSGFLDEYDTKHTYDCEKVHQRIIGDNPHIIKLEEGQDCPDGYYKMALTIKKDMSDYHFYRQDNNGYWSHKNGSNPAKNVDESNKLIKDPKDADRGEYTIFCGYYMVPNKSEFKHMSNKSLRYNGNLSKVEQVAIYLGDYKCSKKNRRRKTAVKKRRKTITKRRKSLKNKGRKSLKNKRTLRNKRITRK